MDQFNINDFKILDIQKIGEIELHINKRYLTFTRSGIEKMGYPQYVQVIVHKNEKVFGIKVCKENDVNAYKFSLPKNEQKKAKYCHLPAIKASVIKMMGDIWDENKHYSCKGIYYPDDKVIAFDLKNCYVRNF